MNRSEDHPAGSAGGDEERLTTSPSRRASRRRLLRAVGQQVALIAIAFMLLAGLTALLLLAFFVAPFVRKEVVTRSTQPGGELAVRVEQRSPWGTCWSVHARPAGAWRWTYIGPQWCEGDHAYLPFRGERLRIAWYPEQGIVTTVEADPGKSIETARFLSAYRYSPDGRKIERIPLVEETAPGDLTPGPDRIYYHEDAAKTLDADDAKIRKILTLPTRVPPTPWPR